MNMKGLLKFNVPKLLFSTNGYKNLNCQKIQFKNLHPEVEDANTPYFRKISHVYNEMAQIATLGLINRWRKAVIDNIQVRKDSQVLDVAGGTGANTIKLLEKAKYLKSDSEFKITLFDGSPYMLKIAQEDCDKLGYNPEFVKFIEGNIHELPFDDGFFDTVVMSLAIRDSVNFNVVIKELNRVLKKRGKIIIFDLCYSQNPTIIQRLYCIYFEYILSIIEKIRWGNLGISVYAVTTLYHMLSESEIQRRLANANFENLEFKPLSFGIAGITIGYKL